MGWVMKALLDINSLKNICYSFSATVFQNAICEFQPDMAITGYGFNRAYRIQSPTPRI